MRSSMLGYGGLFTGCLLAFLVMLRPGRETHRAPPDLDQEFAEEGLTSGVVRPVRPPRGLHPEKVALGRLLFHDVRLSGDQTRSCATCHDLARYGVDGLPRSPGIDGEDLPRNAPTVLNAALHFRQFWDGRARSLEEQVDGPLLSPREMGGSWKVVLQRLDADATLRSRFHSVYGRLDAGAVRHAIAEFERSLLTLDAPFDQYLRGDENAIDETAKRGYRDFLARGCAACHQGEAVGGNSFQRFGVSRPRSGERQAADQGRFDVTGREEDRMVFKVPSLRNVAKTGPYFHDGSVKTLAHAVRLMGRMQLGDDLPEEEVRRIVAFLKTLTGELPE